MKNIFIGGVAKSGKSRLATELCKRNNYNHIPIDYFASSFKHNFPEIGITSNVIINRESSKLLAKFLSRFINIVESNEGEYFILDSAHIYPEDIINYLDPEKWDIYYLAYPNVNAEEKLNEIKKYVNDGWINKRSEKELFEIFGGLINLSKVICEECKENNIKFIDTSNVDIINVFDFDNQFKKL